jgi:ATP-dependent 26S proteasome regulatory subunit
VDVDAQRQGKAVVLKTTTRQTIFLPVIGLVDGDKLKPADLVGLYKLNSVYHSSVGGTDAGCAMYCVLGRRALETVWFEPLNLR